MIAGPTALQGSPWNGRNLNDRRGVFYNRSRTTQRDIHDGLSTTFLFGEANGVGLAGATPQKDPFSWMGCGYSVTWSAPSDRSEPYWRFHGDHPDVVLFAFCDGAVHAMTQNIEPDLFHSLGSVNFSEAVRGGGRSDEFGVP
jgi:hypothetical protein